MHLRNKDSPALPSSVTQHKHNFQTLCLALQVRAYDKQALMPDALLGEARVNLSEQSLGDSTVAGSGGGANVQVCAASTPQASSLCCFVAMIPL